jgi:hypothetical protein
MICVRAITSRQTGGLWARDPVQGGACYPLSQNPYVYAWDDPVDRIDPTGKGAITDYVINLWRSFDTTVRAALIERHETFCALLLADQLLYCNTLPVDPSINAGCERVAYFNFFHCQQGLPWVPLPLE